jgi:hypothetical protein
MREMTLRAKRKGSGKPKDKFDVRAPAEWVAKATAAAEALGLSLSAYVRLAVSERIGHQGRASDTDEER